MLDVNDPENKGIMDTLEEMMKPNKSSVFVPLVEPEQPEPPEPPVEPEQPPKTVKKSLFNGQDVDNPYRNQSKINLDETMVCFRRIETELLLELIKKKNTNWGEMRIWLYIFHMTRGFNKGKKGSYEKKLYRHTHYIENHEIVEMTGLSSSSVSEGLKKLKEKKMIYEKIDERGNRQLGCSFRYDTWE